MREDTPNQGESYTLESSSRAVKPWPEVTKMLAVTPRRGWFTVETLFCTDDSSECSPWAWYYDYPNAPTSIVLCAELCRTVHSEPVPELMVGYGCVTRPL